MTALALLHDELADVRDAERLRRRPILGTSARARRQASVRYVLSLSVEFGFRDMTEAEFHEIERLIARFGPLMPVESQIDRFRHAALIAATVVQLRRRTR